jgi:hypothetical protein
MINYQGLTLKDFSWEEGYSSKWENGKRLFKVVPIPDIYLGNAFEVFRNLQLIRTYFDKPLIITPQGCMYRTKEYNGQVGGSLMSQHLYANAADVRIAGVSPNKIYEFARSNTAFRGFGIARTFIHLDLRPKFTLWYY